MIDSTHSVRIVNQVIEKIDSSPLLDQYKGGGCSSYHPRMLLKVLVYAYINNIYSSRKIEAALKENIHFMWLSGMSRPDHNTINRFRSERLKKVLQSVFGQVVKLLNEAGHVSLQEVYTDGTKIEANANRYTFVWGRSIATNQAKMEAQLKELWSYAESVAKEELKDNAPESFAPISPEQVLQTVDRIDQALKDKPVCKKKRAKLTYIRRKWPAQIAKYKEQQAQMGSRNSCSKTDGDATFMRMKEDHMQNGQLKPGYNLQVSTHEQFIVHYSLHPNPTDTTTLASHLASFHQTHQCYPSALTADAGYGSEENYALLEGHGIEAYVKYASFDKEQQEKTPSPFAADQLHYNAEQDVLYCPMGQAMHRIKTFERITENGFKQQIKTYQARNCEGCPMRSGCFKAKGNRKIDLNHGLRAYKEQARERLCSAAGIEKRRQRCIDVEPVFGNLKYNKGFKRFLLRGKEKVSIEIGLLALAHNLSKLTKKGNKGKKLQNAA